MIGIVQQLPIKWFIDNFSSINLTNVLELSIVAICIYKIFKYVGGTKAEQPLKGVFMLFVALLLSKLFHLQILAKLLENILNILIFSLVVIFQPELRKLLGYLGQPVKFGRNLFNNEQRPAYSRNVIDEITESVRHLSKSRTGALMVIQNNTSLESYMEVGTRLNADVSVELLLTIFHTNTPLHDGAVIIDGNAVLAAGVLLPLTEDPTLSWKYGTRHRAAIGMSEVTDATCIVVSEETGEISLARKGLLEKCNSSDELKSKLEELLSFEDGNAFDGEDSSKLDLKDVITGLVTKK